MSEYSDAVYRLAPGTESLRTTENTLVLKNSSASVELKGDSANFFDEKVIPAMNGKRSVSEIAAQAGLGRSEPLAELLSDLNRAGVLLRGDDGDSVHPFLDYAEMVGLDREETAERLSTLSVLVLGDQALGKAVESQLLALPLQKVTILGMPSSSVGISGNVVHYDSEESEVLDADDLGESRLGELTREYDYVISTIGSAFPAVDYRLNRVIHRNATPALFCRIESAKGTVGPLVFPHESSCYTCWQMRRSACVSSFSEHMQFQEASVAREAPALEPVADVSYLAAIMAGMTVNELLKSALAMGQTAVVDHVLELEPLKGGWSSHAVRRRVDCPVCVKKKLTTRATSWQERLRPEQHGELLKHAERLISPSTGIVRSLSRVHKDLSEVVKPYIFRAEIANHRFLDDDKNSFMIASGKGFSEESARLSALGEAMERYSASTWGEERVLRGRAEDLAMASLDPARLVLFDESQYSSLTYDSYYPDASLGWVAMHSLVSGQKIAVPALAVLMAYETVAGEPYLFPITSNGLAAGETLDHAILAAAYECIERDTFLYTWLNRLPCKRLSIAAHPDADVRALVKAHERRSIILELYQLPTLGDVVVCMAIAVSGEGVDGPAAVVGLGAHHSLVQAATSALIETAQVRPSLRMRLRLDETQKRLRELLEDPAQVSTLEDHDLLYTHHSMLPCFDFIRAAAEEPVEWEESSLLCRHERLVKLAQSLVEEGSELLYADLTSDDIRDTGVHVVRVVLPDYQPMHFGRNERRLAATRLYDMPVRLQLSAVPSSSASLNPNAHPLA